MSEKPVKPKDVVSLDVETNLQTTEGRVFLNQISKVSRVLYLKDSAVEFKGEQLLKTGYIADFKSVMLYKCPNGYFIFGDKAFGKRRMRDRYVILGTLAEFDAEALIQNKSERTRSAGAPVPAILQQALAAKNDTTRGDSGNQVPVRERNWGSTWLDVHVQYKAPKNQKKQQK